MALEENNAETKRLDDDTDEDIPNKMTYREERRLPRGFAKDSANP